MKDLKERTHSHSTQYMRASKKRILRPHNDALSVAAMRVSNPDRSPDASNKTTKTLRHAPKGITLQILGNCLLAES